MMTLHPNADLLEVLRFYAWQGYQIVFDLSGIRVWYLPTDGNLKLYEGDFMHDALREIEEHFAALADDCKREAA